MNSAESHFFPKTIYIKIGVGDIVFDNLQSIPQEPFVGTFNELSPWLLAWATYAGGDSSDLQSVPNLPVMPADLPVAEVRRRTKRWTSRKRLDAIAAIRVDSSSHWAQNEDYRRHNAWQGTVIRALDEDPEWVASQHRSYPQLGLELTIFQRAAN